MKQTDNIKNSSYENIFDRLFDEEHEECIKVREGKKSLISRQERINLMENYILAMKGDIDLHDFNHIVIHGLMLDSIICLKAALFYLGQKIVIFGGAIVCFIYLNQILDRLFSK